VDETIDSINIKTAGDKIKEELIDLLNKYEEDIKYALRSGTPQGFIDFLKEYIDVLGPTSDSVVNDIKAHIPATTPGGIDLNSRNMQMGIQKEGNGVDMQFDPAMIERIKTEGFDGLEFRIKSIAPAPNLPLLLGLESSKEEKRSAGV
jgi:hypothetical protein